MPEDVQGAPADSPQPDASAVSSTEPTDQTQTPEQGTPPSTQTETKPWNMPPEQRWQEVLRERDEARRAFQELATRQAQPVIAQAPLQAQDPWMGLVDHPDAQTAQFWQQQRRLHQYERQMAKQEALQELQPVIDAGMKEIARMSTVEFRRQNPDIKPGSEDERLVVAYMNGQMDGVRHPMESAKRNAMYDKLETENRALKGKHSTVQTKVAANFSDSSSGIPSTSGLPQKPPDWRDTVRETLRKGGDLTDVANAIGMRRTQSS